MKSLKARFKKADVSAVPREVGTHPGMTQISQGHGDLPQDVHGDVGTCSGMSKISQGRGDLPWDVPNFTGT